MIKKTITRWCKNGIIEKSDEDIYEYGLELVLYTTLNIVAVLCSATIIGKLPESLALLVITLPLQSFGGGYHAKTHLRCFLIMYIGWWVAIFMLPIISKYAAAILVCIAILAVFYFAPVPHINIRMSELQKQKMRKYSRVSVIIAAFASMLFTYIISVRIGIALSTGLGIIALSMLIASIKNLLTNKTQHTKK